MKSLPSRRFSRFGVSRSAGRSGSTAAAQSEGGADTTVSASQSEVTSSPANILNNGTATSTVTVTLRNASGTPLSGKTVTLSSTGSNNTIVQPGTTNGSGVATGTLASTTAETKTVTAVSEGITITDTATVTTAEAPVLDFYSKWPTTGTNATARGDSSKWNTFTGNNPGLEVIASTGLDFPTPNVLAVTEHVTPALDKVLRKTGLTVPAVGESRYYRVYFRVGAGAAVAVTDTETHPIQDGSSAGQINQGWWIYHATGGTGKWTLNYQQSGTANSYPNYIWRLTTALDYDTTYRLEWYVDRTGTTTFKTGVRVYDSAGTLLYTSADFRNATSSTDLETYMASNDLNFYNAANLGGLNAGSNGLGGTEGEPTGFIYSYQGAMATGIDTGWIGAYNASNET